MSRLAVVLIGSPKGLDRSSSAQLARKLTEPFDSEKWSLEWIHLYPAVNTDEGVGELCAKVDAADLVILAAPLYVDCLSAPTIRALESIAAHRGKGENERVPSFCVLLNCGFAEPLHNKTCVEICRRFAEAARFEWYGGLALGAGGNTNKRVRKALQEAGEALNGCFPISIKTQERVKKPVMPRLLYILGGNFMWRRVAKQKHGVSKEGLLARPYE